MTTSRTARHRVQRIQFRIGANREPFWQACLQAAAEANQPLGEWLYDRLKTQPIHPDAGPMPSVDWIRGLDCGRRQGWLMAQLDQAFGPAGPGTLDREALRRWIQQYPADWADLTGWIRHQSWGPRFHQWWGPLE